MGGVFSLNSTPGSQIGAGSIGMSSVKVEPNLNAMNMNPAYGMRPI